MFDFLFHKRRDRSSSRENSETSQDRLPPVKAEEILFNPLGRIASAVKSSVNEMNRSVELETEEQIRQHLSQIAVVAFVGPSGTGKSTRAIKVAKENGINYIIDDGILIHGSSIVAGSSAKKAATKIESVKAAIFADETRAQNMRRALLEEMPPALMILGTSREMIDRICQSLYLPKPSMLIRIEDISTEDERREAKETRMTQGKHTIPVPTMEIRHEFSGSLAEPLNKLRRRFDRSDKSFGGEGERTVVRPTFSTLGAYSISDDAMAQIVRISLKQVEGVAQMRHFRANKEPYGATFEITISLYYGYPAQEVMRAAQTQVAADVSQYTSINVLQVDIRADRLIAPSPVQVAYQG